MQGGFDLDNWSHAGGPAHLLTAFALICHEVNSSSVLTILERGQGTAIWPVRIEKELEECKLNTLALNGNKSSSYKSPTQALEEEREWYVSH
jgi:hypothetical protein